VTHAIRESLDELLEAAKADAEAPVSEQEPAPTRTS
jgi:hypothetical protein